jgi:hypothetical protein
MDNGVPDEHEQQMGLSKGETTEEAEVHITETKSHESLKTASVVEVIETNSEDAPRSRPLSDMKGRNKRLFGSVLSSLGKTQSFKRRVDVNSMEVDEAPGASPGTAERVERDIRKEELQKKRLLERKKRERERQEKQLRETACYLTTETLPSIVYLPKVLSASEQRVIKNQLQELGVAIRPDEFPHLFE